MEPVTRKEMFLAKAGGQSVATPEPITREEIFLQRIAENGGSGGVSSWNEVANAEVTSAYNETGGVFGFTVYWLTQLRPDKATMAIVYDGVRYDNQQPATVEGLGELFGNLYYLNAMYGTSFENTGEPFIGFYNGHSLYFMTLDPEATKHTVSVMVYGKPYINYPVIDLKSYIDDISLEGDWVVLNDLPVLKEWHKILMQNDAVWIDAVVDGRETSFVVHPVRSYSTSVNAFTPVILSGGKILFVYIDLKEDQITVYARPA